MTREEFIAKFKVGSLVTKDAWPNGVFEKISAIGEVCFLSVNSYGQENFYVIYSADWKLYEEPEQGLMSPAIVDDGNGTRSTSYHLYKTLDGAKKGCGEDLIQWPARALLRRAGHVDVEADFYFIVDKPKE